MRILGFDPSSGSSSTAGMALAVSGRVEWAAHWKPVGLPGPIDVTRVPKLAQYKSWLDQQLWKVLEDGPVDLAVVEFASNVAYGYRSAIRVLAHYEAATYLACHEQGIKVRHDVTATTAREHLFQTKDKAEAARRIQAITPGLTFANDDEADAGVMSLAEKVPPPKPKKRKAKKR